MRSMQTIDNTGVTTMETTATQDTVIQDTAIEDTVDRYLVMFNEADDAVRAELAHEVFVDDGRLVDPLIEATGPDGIAAAIGGLRDQMPGHSLTRTTALDTHHSHARFGWTVNGPDGGVAVAGIDVVTIAPDGRIETAIGFFGDPAAVA
jgi:SnoaL-like protein